MLKKLIPQEKGFFERFEQMAEKVLQAAQQFKVLVHDLPQASDHAKTIESGAIEGDKLTRGTFDLLHRTFITPFDRYDIHKLASNMDDVLDLFNSTAQKIALYQIIDLPNEIQKLADMAFEIARLVKSAVHHLDSLKQSEEILNDCRQILAIRIEADDLSMNGIAQLFENEGDLKALLKKKEVYESVKRIFDKSQNLANIMKGIVLEYA